MKLFIRLVDGQGVAQITEWDTATQGKVPKGAVETGRKPGPFEDFIDGAWVYDADAHADERAGPAHIAAAHAQKLTEAVWITSGHALPTGWIAAEAARRGVTPAELAAIVLVKAAEFMAAELARQAPDIAAKKLVGGTKK